MKKIRAGYYTGKFFGRRVDVEYVDRTAYGDKGWFAWVAGENVTEWPRPTRREALEVALATIRAT